MDKLKVFICCTGVGIFNRGIETFARECYDGLHGMEGLDLKLLKGAGSDVIPGERRLWCFPRTGRIARWLGKATRRNGYVVEQLSSFIPLVRQIRLERPDLIFLSEGNLRRRLWQARSLIGVPFRIAWSNGGPVNPPFPDCDHVQQLTPFHLDQAIQEGEPKSKHSLVPYGINVPPGNPLSDSVAIESLRYNLGLPVDRQIILSVGSLSLHDHKRMDYSINEISLMPEPRPYLMLLGSMDDSSAELIVIAEEKLGLGNFSARSVSSVEVADYYRASDVFVLGSLQEGFGRVYLEALMHGLPCIVHDHAIMRYVLGEEAIFADLSKTGGMATALSDVLINLPRLLAAEVRNGRRESVRQRFSWEILAPQYLEMFRIAANQSSL